MHLADKWKNVYIRLRDRSFSSNIDVIFITRKFIIYIYEVANIFPSTRMATHYNLSKWWKFSGGENSSIFDTCKVTIYSSRSCFDGG
jgi:hypothetical protein